MQTFLCSTLKQYGAHIVILPILVTPVYMHTIGKITGESRISMIMTRNNAQTGKWKHLSKTMQWMAARTSIDAKRHMGGKNKNITLWTTKFMLVVLVIIAIKFIVPIIILMKIEGNL